MKWAPNRLETLYTLIVLSFMVTLFAAFIYFVAPRKYLSTAVESAALPIMLVAGVTTVLLVLYVARAHSVRRGHSES